MKVYPLLFLLLFQATISLGQGSGKALKLNGINEYVLFSQQNRGIKDQITVSAWVKTTSSKYHWIVGKYDRFAESGYHLYIRDGRAAFAGRDGSFIYRNSGPTTTLINDNKWHHIIGICDKGIWQIYVDGILQSETITGFTRTNLESTAPLAIGKDYLADNEHFDGEIDELRIWKKVLSVSEIREGMCQKLPEASSELVAHYTFDEGIGSTVIDRSVLNLNGSFMNLNPATAWVTSGAPIGDKSTYLYTSTWLDKKVELPAPWEVNLSIDSVGENTQGLHLYYVLNKPNYSNEVPDPNQIEGYFGFFTPLSPDNKHRLNFIKNQLLCKVVVLERNNNSKQQWIVKKPRQNSSIHTIVSTTNRGEYLLAESKATFPIELPTEFYACTGEKVSIDASLDGATYLWSNGKTTPAIEVTSPAIVSLEITYKGCTTSKSFTISDDECITIPNIITPNGDNKNDSFVIKGANPADLEVQIFNRWGVSLFKRSGYDGNWSAQNLAAGTYYYVIKSNRSNRTFKGWVEVVF